MTDRPLSTGDALRTVRRSRNLAQREIGTLVGRSQQWVAAVEAGRIELSLGQAVAISRHLGVKVEALIEMPQEYAS